MNYDALNQAGIAAALADDLTTAIAWFQRAIAQDPARWEGFFNLGNAWAALGDREPAIAAYEAALAREPGPAVYFNLGALQDSTTAQAVWEAGWERFPQDRDLGLAVAAGRMQRGDRAGAIAVYETLLQGGEDATVRSAWGLLLQQMGEQAGAIAQFEAGLATAPEDPYLLANLGGLLTEAQRWAEALPLLQKAVAIAPDLALAHSNLGTAQMAAGDAAGAVQSWQTACRCDPQGVVPYQNLARYFQQTGQEDMAIAVLVEGYGHTGDGELGLALATALEQAGRGEALAVYEKILDKEPYRCEVYRRMLRLLSHGHWAVERWGAARQWADRYLVHCSETDFWGVRLARLHLFFQAGDSAAARQELALCQGMLPPVAQIAELAFAAVHLQDDPAANQALFQAASAAYAVQPCGRSVGRPPRIGFLSPNFREHPIGKLVPPILSHLGEHTAVFAYVVPRYARDRYTEDLSNLPQITCRELAAAATAETIATAIAQDQIDVLVDLDGHTESLNLQVLALGAAPRQLSWLGFDAPNLSDRHGAIVDAYTHPPTADALYRETLWRLPHAHIAVSSFPETTCSRTALRQTWGLEETTVVYFSPAAGRKLNPETVEAHVQILQAVPNSVLVRKGKGDTAAIARLYDEACTRWGVNPQRLRLLPYAWSEDEHYGYYRAVDVVLDSYPYNGGSLTLESLWYTRPVISLCGRQAFARMGYSFNTAAGLPATVVDSWAAYVDLAVQAGREPDRRHFWQETLAQGQTHGAPLWHTRAFADDLWHLLQRIAASP